MFIRTRVLPVASALVFALSVSSVQATAQDKKAPPKVDKVQQAEIASAVKIVDDAMSGQPAPSDIKFTWKSHLMRGREGKQYIPFLMLFDKDQKLPAAVSYYVRVANKATIAEQLKAQATYKAAVQKAENEAALDPENLELADTRDKLKAQPPKVEYPFEDFKTFNLNGQAGAQGFRVPSALMVTPGEYEVYMLVKEPTANVKDKKAQPKAGLLKATLTVPDYGDTPLATSSVMLTKGDANPQAQPLQNDPNRNPYVFLMVSPDQVQLEPKFDKKALLTVGFFIYNVGVDATTKQPNLSVVYAFWHKENGAEKYFNATQPQALDGGKSFDPAVGVFAGTAIPLESFPDGDFRLEIKITDKVSGKSKVENVPFTVIVG